MAWQGRARRMRVSWGRAGQSWACRVEQSGAVSAKCLELAEGYPVPKPPDPSPRLRRTDVIFTHYSRSSHLQATNQLLVTYRQ